MALYSQHASLNLLTMIRNYFTIAFRSLLRNRSYTFINITGLALGITTCMVIFLIILHDTRFDTFHADTDRIYRVVHESITGSGIEKSNGTPYPVANALRQDFPELEAVTQINVQESAFAMMDAERSSIKNIVFADSAFFDVFGFEAVSGNPKKDLATPGKVFLSEAFAKTLKKGVTHIKLENKLDLEIAGIIKTPPAPSHIVFNLVVSWPSFTPGYLGFPLDEWGLQSGGYTYVKLAKNTTPQNIESRFPGFIKKYGKPEDVAKQKYMLQPLSTIHFVTDYTGNTGVPPVNPTTLCVLGFIGLFILIVACVNFINLATALSVKKSKEVGVRKTLGAQQGQLAVQYLAEAFLITLIAAVLSIGLAEWTTPLAGNFLQKDLTLNIVHNGPALLFLAAVVVFTAILSGLYPALVLSRFNPVKALKSRFSDTSTGAGTLRKSLVVLQFFIAQVLIICTLVVSGQIRFFHNKPLGFAKDAVINVSLPDNNSAIVDALRERLLNIANVEAVSMSVGAPIGDNNFGTEMFLSSKGKAEEFVINLKPADMSYKDVYGLQLVEGRWFTETDARQAAVPDRQARRYVYIITEASAKALGFNSPRDIIGKEITTGLNRISAPVVGVLKDFNTSSLRTKLSPVVFICYPGLYYDAGIKLAAADIPATLKKIEASWQESYPNFLFQYTFLDDYVGKLYQQEENMFILLEIFAGIAIVIGCLGLYGLASFMANQKTKEVAIRKTLGASAGQIVVLFSKEFVFLIAIAFVIAAPIAYYSMDTWLKTFEYQIRMGWTVFAAGILFTLTIAFLTVGYRSLRAALSNPVNALKSE